MKFIGSLSIKDDNLTISVSDNQPEIYFPDPTKLPPVWNIIKVGTEIWNNKEYTVYLVARNNQCQFHNLGLIWQEDEYIYFDVPPSEMQRFEINNIQTRDP